MESPNGFALAVSQNKYLSPADTEMRAVLTVSAANLTTPGAALPDAAEVIVIDCSGSMSYPPTKLTAARNAAAAAIDALRDGVFFAVVEGNENAAVVYPGEPALVAATPQTKQAAKQVVRQLAASGGTSLGAWLRLADELLAAHPSAVRHAILLTDGQNLEMYQEDLDEALASCAGRFVCDGRGIGDDYEPEDLMRIASAMRGTADAIIDYADLVPEFVAIMNAAMRKVLSDVRLDITPLPFARLRSLRQTFPTEIDLTPFGTAVDARTTGFSTGTWAEGEEREFLVWLDAARTDQHDMEEDVKIAKVGLAIVPAGDTVARQAVTPRPIVVCWTDDLRRSSLVDPSVAHASGHAELAAMLKDGMDAYKAGDFAGAAVEWGRAVAKAAQLGHDDMLTRLRRIVEIVGEPTAGRVVVKPDLRNRELFSVIVGGSTTTRHPKHSRPDVDPAPVASKPAPGTGGRCPVCTRVNPPEAKNCEQCGKGLGRTA